MHQLIAQIREAIPFALSPEQMCDGECRGCSLKLVEFLDSELISWEMRLRDGEKPDLLALSRLARTAKRIHKVLERNGIIDHAA